MTPIVSAEINVVNSDRLSVTIDVSAIAAMGVRKRTWVVENI